MNVKYILLRLCVAQCLLMASAVTSAIDPQPTNTTSFDIPFVVEGVDGRSPTGFALLFTSVNGSELEQTQRVPSSAGAFHFTASTDGLYAFAVRMTDESGQMVGNAGPIVPELEILVDTAAPDLRIQLTESSPGNVEVEWTTSEGQVAPGSVRLEYAEGTDGRWMPVADVTEANGKKTLQIQPGTAASVRGYVTDLAGNQGTGTAELVLAASGRSNAAEGQRPSGHIEIPGIPVAHTTSTTSSEGSVAAPPIGTVPFPQVGAMGTFPAPDGGHNGFAIPEAPTAEPAFPGHSGPAAQRPAAAPAIPWNDTLPGERSHEPSGGHAVTRHGSQHGPVSLPQMINNRVFNIAYKVDEVGPSGVGSVDLYVTENNGQQWFRYGSDADKQSPFQVDTRGEGTFGFTVRVRNGLGFSDPPPQPGEVPDMTVVVDQTPPDVHLAPPRVVFNNGGRIRLEWQISGALSEDIPVRLEQASNASGPWSPVFDWQADTGHYDVALQPGTPTTLHFRLLARDAAGNLATAQTARPVLVDQRRPSARLLQVQPVTAVRRY